MEKTNKDSKKAKAVTKKADKSTDGNGVKRPKPLVKKWWFWTAIAAVLVVALVLGATLSYAIPSWGMRIACKPGKPVLPENYEQVLTDTKKTADLSYESAFDNGFMDIYMRKNTTGKQPLVVYIHGGYYIGGDKEAFEPYCRILAQAGYVVANINYALAPESKYPSQARQVNEALAFLKRNADTFHIDTHQIFLAGDSAGGHLSAQMGAFYTNDELSSKMGIERAIQPDDLKGVILNCGFYNTDTVREAKFPFLPTALWALTDVRTFEKYSRIDELNVVKNVTKHYPDAFVLCGDKDPFYGQAKELVSVLEENKVSFVAYLPETKKGGAKLGHEFQKNFGTEEADTAMQMVIAFLNERSVFDEGNLYLDQNVYATFVLDNATVFEVQLFPEYAPKTVQNFINYAESGFYNGTIFHRIIPGQVLQGGGYIKGADDTGSIAKDTVYDPIKGEFATNGFPENVLAHGVGTLSMARTSDKNSATSQFFFCSVEISAYDGEYAAFGTILNADGIESLTEMTFAPIDSEDFPLHPVTLVSIEIRVEKK